MEDSIQSTTEHVKKTVHICMHTHTSNHCHKKEYSSVTWITHTNHFSVVYMFYSYEDEK